MTSQLDRIEEKLDEHIKESGEKHLQISNAITALLTNERVNHGRITEQAQEIDKLKTAKSLATGVIWALGVLGGILSAIVGWLIAVIF